MKRIAVEISEQIVFPCIVEYLVQV